MSKVEKYIKIENLSVSDELFKFVNEELLPGTKITQKDFWEKFDSFAHELTPENRKLINEGFVFTDQVFSLKDAENSKNAFWSVINCKYDTGMEPENRFWNPGDNPKDIIKIEGLKTMN